VGSWFVTCATVPLAFGLAGNIYVVFAAITASAIIGVIVSCLALVLIVGLWHALPLVSRRRHRYSSI
jgi:hypothetical protein